MREEVADLVYPVLTHGIRLKQRLEGGDAPDFAIAQKELQGLLQTAGPAKHLWDIAGDRLSQEDSRRHSDQFLGVRYALVCWLDEIFILDSPWKEQWSKQSLEWDLYKSRDRAWKFWKQAEWASARPTTDALEVFYLCVMLGFRGEPPEPVPSWCERVKAQIEQGQSDEFNLAVEGQPRTYVPPLEGERGLQTMLTVAGAALLLLIPVLTFLLVLSGRNR
jgi:type VI secretion system protein ImpK